MINSSGASHKALHPGENELAREGGENEYL